MISDVANKFQSILKGGKPQKLWIFFFNFLATKGKFIKEKNRIKY